jgi:hypothetical protein
MEQTITYKKSPYTLQIVKNNEISFIFKIQPDIVCTIDPQKLKEAIENNIEALKLLLEVLQNGS